ncbi:unnamed protein product [Boreogadus saida]
MICPQEETQDSPWWKSRAEAGASVKVKGSLKTNCSLSGTIRKTTWQHSRGRRAVQNHDSRGFSEQSSIQSNYARYLFVGLWRARFLRIADHSLFRAPLRCPGVERRFVWSWHGRINWEAWAEWAYWAAPPVYQGVGSLLGRA